MDDLGVTDTPVLAGKRTARSSLPIRICFRNTPYSTLSELIGADSSGLFGAQPLGEVSRCPPRVRKDYTERPFRVV